MSKFSKTVEKMILRQVQYAIEDMDIEGLIKRATNSKTIKEQVQREVKDELATMMRNKIFSELHKHDKYIDSWGAEQIDNLLTKLGIK